MESGRLVAAAAPVVCRSASSQSRLLPVPALAEGAALARAAAGETETPGGEERDAASGDTAGREGATEETQAEEETGVGTTQAGGGDRGGPGQRRRVDCC